jgi:pimeloyl-ACP methyl ester carboxylesterase
MSNHSLPISLDGLSSLGVRLRKESSALWVRKTPVKTCVVFVHGYGGRAIGTWGDFPKLATNGPEFDEVDLIFLGYESRWRPAEYNVGVIYDVVSLLAEEPVRLLAKVNGPERPSWLGYERIVLVGHSLGGALVRTVAMSAKTEGKAWATKLRLALFAPAHKGANVIELVLLSAGFLKWAGLPQAVALAISPVLRDLQKGSEYLKALLSAAEGIGDHCTSKAAFVAHASGDKVVFQDRFYLDPPLHPYESQNHVSCCKPIASVFERPVLDLIKVLE